MYLKVPDWILEKAQIKSKRLGVSTGKMAKMAMIKGLSLPDNVFAEDEKFQPAAQIHKPLVITSPDPLNEDQMVILLEKRTTLTTRQLADLLGVTFAATLEGKRILARAYLKENWEKKTDQEVAAITGLKWVAVVKIRQQMGLMRNADHYLRKVDAKIFDWKLIEEELVNGGKTMTGILREKKLKITRQRMQQLAAGAGIKHSPADRTFKWYASYHNKPQLADKEWIETKLKELGGVSALAAEIGMTIPTLQNICLRQGIAEELTRGAKTRANLVEVTCGNPACQKKFMRSSHLIKKTSSGKYFCTKSCRGTEVGRRSKIPSEVIMCTCHNPDCRKTFERRVPQTVNSERHFCNHVCFLTWNNKYRRGEVKAKMEAEAQKVVS